MVDLRTQHDSSQAVQTLSQRDIRRFGIVVIFRHINKIVCRSNLRPSFESAYIAVFGIVSLRSRLTAPLCTIALRYTLGYARADIWPAQKKMRQVRVNLETSALQASYMQLESPPIWTSTTFQLKFLHSSFLTRYICI